MMKTVSVGGSGIEGSRLAVGCMRLSSLSQEALQSYIHTAIDCGVTFFDHADIYGGGESERLFGKVLKSEPGLREQITLQSKCGIRPGQ